MNLTPKQELNFRMDAAKAEMHFDVYQALTSYVTTLDDAKEVEKVRLQIKHQRKAAIALIKKAMDTIGGK